MLAVCHLHPTKAWDVMVTGRCLMSSTAQGCIPDILSEVLVGAHQHMAMNWYWDWLRAQILPKILCGMHEDLSWHGLGISLGFIKSGYCLESVCSWFARKNVFVAAGLYLQMNIPQGEDYSLFLPADKIHAKIPISWSSCFQHTKEKNLWERLRKIYASMILIHILWNIWIHWKTTWDFIKDVCDTAYYLWKMYIIFSS